MKKPGPHHATSHHACIAAPSLGSLVVVPSVHPPPLLIMLSRTLTRATRLVSQPAVQRSGAAAASFSSPAEDAAKKMTFGNKNITSKVKPNNIKQFKIYRWNPDTAGQTTRRERRMSERDDRAESRAAHEMRLRPRPASDRCLERSHMLMRMLACTSSFFVRMCARRRAEDADLRCRHEPVRPDDPGCPHQDQERAGHHTHLPPQLPRGSDDEHHQEEERVRECA